LATSSAISPYCRWLEPLPIPITAFAVRDDHPSARPSRHEAALLSVERKVGMRDFEMWLEASPHSPAEMNLEARLREFLQIALVNTNGQLAARAISDPRISLFEPKRCPPYLFQPRIGGT
jgi:hypothetical protein